MIRQEAREPYDAFCASVARARIRAFIAGPQGDRLLQREAQRLALWRRIADGLMLHRAGAPVAKRLRVGNRRLALPLSRSGAARIERRCSHSRLGSLADGARRIAVRGVVRRLRGDRLPPGLGAVREASWALTGKA